MKAEYSGFSNTSVNDLGMNAIGISYILTSHLYALNSSVMVFEEITI